MTTPIITYTDYRRSADSDNVSDYSKDDVRELIEQVSALVELETDRRFDRRLEARDFDARQETDGGNINSDGFLILDDDLISPLDVINNHTVTVDADNYSLLPNDPSAIYRYGIRLRRPGYWAWDATLDSFDAIQVYGFWGYGGEFRLKTTVATLMDDADGTVTLSVASNTGLEYGQMLQVGTGASLEYMLIVGEVESNNLLVQRAYNGTEPVQHDIAQPVYLFRADPVVRRVVTRIMKWQSELDDSPLLATVQIGDTEQAVNLSAAPDDVQKTLERLSRKQSIGKV